MKKVAITGGIGSGKSTVLSILRNKGFVVFSCDEVYKEVITSNQYIEKISKYFPKAVINGVIDRAILSETIFQSAEQQELLNSIAHPLIIERLFQKIEKSNADLVFVEVPLLFEANLESKFDNVIVVMREDEERINAVCVRDTTTKENVLKRIKSQFDYHSVDGRKRIEACNARILVNEDSIEYLQNKINSILNTI